jgi:pimeloyl-ACP methyl ester carboxylesterase
MRRYLNRRCGTLDPMPDGLHHVREGAGPPLVLLAGIGASGASWQPVVERLAREREVWRVDLPGFGGSAPFDDGKLHGLETLTDAAARFIAEAGLERPHVAGNSLGGAVALELGRRELVASVTALSPAGFASRPGQLFAGRSLQLTYHLGSMLRPLAPRIVTRPRLRRLFYAQMFAHPERLTPGQAYADLVTLIESKGFLDTLTELDGHRFEGEIDVPVTVAWGTRDALLLPTQALRARRLLPGAHHVWLHGCGHVPMNDDPEQVARVLLHGSARTRSTAPADRPPARRDGAAGRPASPASSR